MKERELHCGRAELDAMTLADRFDLLRFLDQMYWRSNIIVRGAGFDATGEDTGIVGSAQDHGYAPLHAFWQECIKTALLKQRIAAGQQHTVEIAGLDEAQARVRLVDPDTDGPDNAGPPTFVERLEARIHHRLETLLEDGAILDGPEIDVMDQRYVDTS